MGEYWGRTTRRKGRIQGNWTRLDDLLESKRFPRKSNRPLRLFPRIRTLLAWSFLQNEVQWNTIFSSDMNLIKSEINTWKYRKKKIRNNSSVDFYFYEICRLPKIAISSNHSNFGCLAEKPRIKEMRWNECVLHWRFHREVPLTSHCDGVLLFCVFPTSIRLFSVVYLPPSDMNVGWARELLWRENKRALREQCWPV